MPNRIIKESLCESEKLSALSDFEFRLWVGLIVQADDAGRGDARPAIIKGRVFPLRERVTAKDIGAALNALAANGCVSLYEIGGRPYYWFPSWTEHQRIRDSKPKYPGPDEENAVIIGSADFRGNSPQVAAVRRDSPQVAASCGLNTIQSEYNTNPNLNTNTTRTGAKAQKKTFGEYQNVLLDDTQLVKLQSEFPDWQERIERLSEYIASTGKKYSDHLATIRNWARKEPAKAAPGASKRKLDDDEAAAIRAMMEDMS